MTRSVDTTPPNRTEPPTGDSRHMPLYVDLDHTLVKTDVAQELLIRSSRTPSSLWGAVRAGLRQGPQTWRNAVKAELARLVPLQADLLPYNEVVLEHIKTARAAGRRVVLATAADQQVAQAVADHLGLFDDIIASSQTQNMKGATKLEAIRHDCNDGAFEYIGDSRADLPIWHAATLRGFTKIPKGAEALAQEASLHPEDHVTDITTWIKPLIKAMRPHQWAKNALLFVPLLFAHLYSDLGSVMLACIGFLSYSLCASSVYLINDLLDVEADRVHPTKCNRPFAAGTLAPDIGVLAAVGLLLSSLVLATLTSGAFVIVLLFYILMTKAYSLWLKRFSTIDVILLAVLYTLRIIAGAAAISVMPSPWILTFSLFFFLSLAYMKRYIELSRLVAKAAENTAQLPVRNYYAGDLTVVQTFGIANGALSLLTMANYINSDTVKQHYHTPEFLWLMLPIMMFWTYRAWMWANRDKIGDDPVAFALRDRLSRLSVLMLLAAVALARYVDLGLHKTGLMG